MTDRSSKSLLAGDGLEGWESGGSFRREGAVVVGNDGGPAGWGDRLMTGDDAWIDYAFGATVTLVSGEMAQLHFRIDPASRHRRWYTLDLRHPDQRVTLGWADNGPGGHGLAALVSTPLAVEHGRAYALRVVVRGDTAEGWVDDLAVGRVTGLKHSTGRVGLGIWRCHARFDSPRIELLARGG